MLKSASVSHNHSSWEKHQILNGIEKQVISSGHMRLRKENRVVLPAPFPFFQVWIKSHFVNKTCANCVSGHIPSTSSQALTILERFSTHIKGFVEAVQSASNGLDPISHSSRFFLNKTRRNTLILGSEGAGRGVPLPPGSPSRGGAQSTARGALPARWSRQAVAGPPTPQQALSGGGRSHFFPTARVNRALGQERLREPPLPLPRGDNTGLAPHLATSSPAHCAVPCRAPAAPGRLWAPPHLSPRPVRDRAPPARKALPVTSWKHPLPGWRAGITPPEHAGGGGGVIRRFPLAGAAANQARRSRPQPRSWTFPRRRSGERCCSARPRPGRRRWSGRLFMVVVVAAAWLLPPGCGAQLPGYGGGSRWAVARQVRSSGGEQRGKACPLGGLAAVVPPLAEVLARHGSKVCFYLTKGTVLARFAPRAPKGRAVGGLAAVGVAVPYPPVSSRAPPAAVGSPCRPVTAPRGCSGAAANLNTFSFFWRVLLRAARCSCHSRCAPCGTGTERIPGWLWYPWQQEVAFPEGRGEGRASPLLCALGNGAGCKRNLGNVGHVCRAVTLVSVCSSLCACKAKNATVLVSYFRSLRTSLRK